MTLQGTGYQRNTLRKIGYQGNTKAAVFEGAGAASGPTARTSRSSSRPGRLWSAFVAGGEAGLARGLCLHLMPGSRAQTIFAPRPSVATAHASRTLALPAPPASGPVPPPPHPSPGSQPRGGARHFAAAAAARPLEPEGLLIVPRTGGV